MSFSGKNNSIHISNETILRTIFWGFLLFLFFFLFDIFLVILTSVVIASAIEPAARWLIKYRLPRVLAVLLLYLAFFGVFISTSYFLIPPLLIETFDLLQNAPNQLNHFNFLDSAKDSWLSLNSLLGSEFPLESLLENFQTELEVLVGNAFLTTTKFFGGLFSFILILILSFYLAVQEKGIEKFLELITPFKYEKYILSLWRRSQLKIGLWMKGQLVLSLVIGVLVFLGLTILNVRYALTLAIIAGVLEIIPLFGPVISAIPAFLVGLTEGLPFALGIVALYILIQQFENHLIVPIVIKKVIGVDPIITILSLLIGWKIAGFLGVILAVPVATILLELANDYGLKKMSWQKNNTQKINEG